MTEADPGNELGHFSLGKAYMDAGRYADAAACFERVVQINAQNSRGFHLLAVAQKEGGDVGSACATLRKGIEVAHARGDLMPRNEMSAMLRELGETPPEFAGSAAPVQAPAAAGGDQVACRRCGQARLKMPKPPFKGKLGEQVFANVCASCWQEWVRMGTKVINEMRLNFADPRHAAVYDDHMKEFLNLE
jgi:Fe-S cluster biosynthesis and repair protein YggX